MTEAAAGAYAQLLSLGLLWISFHCAGMCGPLLIGFDVAGTTRGWSIPRGGLGVLTYQAGRAVTYAALGALAGLAGVGLEAALGPAGAIFALIFGATVLTVAFWPARRPRPRPTRLEQRASGDEPRRGLTERLTAALPRALHPVASGGGPSRIFLLGAAMGLLPCMITFWALGLAATTASPLHGAGVMLLLVLMTSPMLLGVTLLPRLAGRLRFRHARRVLLAISGVWLGMVGLAGLEVVPHLHFPVEVFGGHYMIMLW